VFGSFASSMSMQTGAPTFGTPEPSLVLYVVAQLARRLGVPFRSGGSLCASKLPDAQAAYESANTLQATVLGGVNFVLHAAGWLEGGLAIGYEKFILDDDQLGMMATFVRGVDLSENGQALDAIRENGPGPALSRHRAHARELRERLLPVDHADNASYEQWLEDGGLDAAQRANTLWKSRLAAYEPPPIDAPSTRSCARSSTGASPRCPTRSADDANGIRTVRSTARSQCCVRSRPRPVASPTSRAPSICR
jgi:trimethylamine--corrinoid protein Co-methyltransferase